MSISIAILLIVIFSFLTFFIAYFFGSSIFKKKYGDLNELELKIVDAKRRLETSKKEVEREIESFRKEETLKVKEELLNEKKIADDEIKKMKSELATKEERIAAMVKALIAWLIYGVSTTALTAFNKVATLSLAINVPN